MSDEPELIEAEVGTTLVKSDRGSNEDLAVMPVMSLADAKRRRDALVDFVKSIMVEGMDFGTIPGTAKPTLLKPGAEKLTTFFGLTKRFEILDRMEDWQAKPPFFYYLYRSRLLRHDVVIAEGDGSANSLESKYGWRWVSEPDVPGDLDIESLMCRSSSVVEFDFAVQKAETGGKYGKPTEHWDRFRKQILGGTAKETFRKTRAGKELLAWTIDETVYRIPNPDIASQVNTLQKMAQKRALIAATLLAVNASEFFTQDVEDMLGGDATPSAAEPTYPMPEDEVQVAPPIEQDVRQTEVAFGRAPTKAGPHKKSWPAAYVKELVSQGLAENAANAVAMLNLSPFDVKERLQNVMRWAGIFRLRRGEGLEPELAAETAAQEYESSK